MGEKPTEADSSGRPPKVNQPGVTVSELGPIRWLWPHVFNVWDRCQRKVGTKPSLSMNTAGRHENIAKKASIDAMFSVNVPYLHELQPPLHPSGHSPISFL